MERISDEQFKSFVQRADQQPIESLEQFRDWKDDFLRTFRHYLNPEGTAIAREVDEELYEQLEQLVQALATTQQLIETGKISPDASTVSGQKTLNELIALVKSSETSIEKFLPKTKFQETKCGYTKFELAAVLVRDGFSVYRYMVQTRDRLAALVTEGGGLAEILRPNQLTIAMYYFRALEAFTEFLADLGMYQVMEQCVEIYKIRPRHKKKNRYRRSSSKDALDDTTDEEAPPQRHKKPKPKTKKRPPNTDSSKAQKDRNSEHQQLEPGPMFANKHKDKKDVKVRAIMDNGWSNGFVPGQEIKDPKQKNTKKTAKKTTKQKKNKLLSKSHRTAKRGEDDDSGNGENDNGDTRGMLGDSKNPSKPSGDDKLYNTDTTDENEDDAGSSSEEEESDDDEEEDYIYYFDPNQGIVGKISRTKCLQQKLIVSTNRKSGKETYDGLVDHWNSKTEGNTTIPGKVELIGTLKEILRGKKAPVAT